MNDQQLKAALEKFEALLKRQAQRVENMKQQGDFIDFETLPKITIGVCGGDGIGPVITNEALPCPGVPAPKRRRCRQG